MENGAYAGYSYCRMIRLLQAGNYLLSETKGQTKMLHLDNEKTYARVNAQGIGEILASSQKQYIPDYSYP